MTVTLLVEPDPGGHHFQAVASVTAVASRSGKVILLTSEPGAAADSFEVFLKDSPLEVVVRFDQTRPSTVLMAEAVAELVRERGVSTVVLMDGDQALKRWWYAAPRAFRRLPRKPRVIFFLTRYPARLGITDRVGWKLRSTKALLAMLAMMTGCLDRVAGFAGRDDMSRGWLVRRARDPEICLYHSRDRERLRAELGLPQDRALVGNFGYMSERRNSPLILEAMELAGLDDATLVLAGSLTPGVRDWLDGLTPERRARVVVDDGFLPDDVLDKYVACVDVAPIILTNNGPSGIMGKALAAGVPVITAGSRVRATEVGATDGGVTAEIDARSIADALTAVLGRDPSAPRRSKVPPATAEAFAEVVLGLRD